jgi:hypothetical protein
MHSLNKICQFKEFSICWAFGRLTADVRVALVKFWLVNDAVRDPREAWRRTFDVACIALNTQGEIVGVSSIYIDRLAPAESTYWFYRTFIRSDSRVLGLNQIIFNAGFDQLAEMHRAEPASPSGVVVVTENPKLESRGGVRILQRNGLKRLGTDHHGQSVWCKSFPSILG